jgi:uncharacterized protein with NRDE domain
MCTLALSLGADRRWPVVVAANRDERLGRPAESWALREGPDGLRSVAPRDLEAGGTWMGISARGLLAALTNFHAPHDWYPDGRRRSRGDLVPLALGAKDAKDARALLSSVDPAAFNPFHLVVADGKEALLWWYDGDQAGMERLGQGLHLVTEESPHGLGARGDLVRSRWPIDPSPARLREVLTIHTPPAPTPTCIHRDPRYGTRSAAVVRLAPQLQSSELYVADGRPCETPLVDRSELLVALARSA